MQLTFPKLALLAHLSFACGKTLRTTSTGGVAGTGDVAGVAAGGADDSNIVSERDLQSLPCNFVLKTLTSDAIQAMLTQVFLQRSETIVEEMIPLIEFDVQFIKVSSRRLARSYQDMKKIDLIFN